MEKLPGFNDYEYASFAKIPIADVKFNQYLVAETSYKEILEDETLTPEELRHVLLAYTVKDRIDRADFLNLKRNVDDPELNLGDEFTFQDYSDWAINYLEEIEETKKKFELLSDDYQRMNFEEENFYITDPVLDTLHFESVLEVPENIRSMTSFFDVFNVSQMFPCLWFPEKNLFKVHSSYKGDASFINNSMKNDTIYVLYLGNKTGEIFRDDNDEFRIKILLASQNERDNLIDLFNFFPFKLETLNENDAILTYQIRFNEPRYINVESFVYTVMLNGFFSRYLHIMETTNLSSSNFIRLRYIFPFEDTDSKVIPFQLRGNMDIARNVSSKSRLVSTNQEESEGFVEIRIQAESDEVVRPYIEIISHLISEYLNIQPLTNAIVPNFIAENQHLMNSKTRVSLSRGSVSAGASRSTSSRKITNLSNLPMSNFFIDEKVSAIKSLRNYIDLPDVYTSDCTAVKQPRVVKEDKIDEFNSQEFLINDQIYHRLAIPFPSIENPEVYLGCQGNEYPFIGIRNNRNNKVIPCCYAEDQNIPGKPLHSYLQGKVTETTRLFSTATLHTSSILPQGTSGDVQEILGQLFKIYRPQNTFFRYGSVNGNQSFLHALLMARDEEYSKLLSIGGGGRSEVLDQYVTDYRIDLANNLSDEELNVLKETSPDSSYEELRGIIRDRTKYLDPRVFIPLFEYLFDTRLLVFEMDEEKKISLVQPDYLIFRGGYPVSYSPDLTTDKTEWKMICIFGQKNLRTSYPQWELIVQRKKEGFSGDKTRILVDFDEELSERMVAFFLDNIPTYQFNINQENRMTYLSDRLWFNPYAFIKKLRRIKGFRIRGQSIDTLGKVRVLYFEKFSLMIPTISPLPVKIIDDEPYNRNKASIITPLSKLLGKVMYAHQDKNGFFWKVSWTPDQAEGVKSPVEMRISLLFEPVKQLNAEYNEIVIEENEDLNPIPIWKEAIYYRRTAKRLERILTFLFLKYLSLSSDRPEKIKENIEEWENDFIYDENVLYDFSSLHGFYPEGEYLDCLEELKDTGLVDQRKIVLPNNNIYFNLMSYVKRWTLNREGIPFERLFQDHIEGFYEFPGDFIQSPGTRVYVGENAIRSFRSEKRNVLPPEVVKGPFKEISLLQTVANSEYAISRSVNWRREKINADFQLDALPTFGKMNLRDLKQSSGNTNTEKLLYYIEDQVAGRGIVKIMYKAIIPLAENIV